MLDRATTTSSEQVSAVHDAPSDHALDAGLAIARHTAGFTFVALPVPVVGAPALVAAWRSASLVAWTNGPSSIVGVGVARALRGTGATRFTDVIDAAAAIHVGAVVGCRTWVPRV